MATIIKSNATNLTEKLGNWNNLSWDQNCNFSENNIVMLLNDCGFCFKKTDQSILVLKLNGLGDPEVLKKISMNLFSHLLNSGNTIPASKEEQYRKEIKEADYSHLCYLLIDTIKIFYGAPRKSNSLEELLKQRLLKKATAY